MNGAQQEELLPGAAQGFQEEEGRDFEEHVVETEADEVDEGVEEREVVEVTEEAEERDEAEGEVNYSDLHGNEETFHSVIRKCFPQ